MSTKPAFCLLVVVVLLLQTILAVKLQSTAVNARNPAQPLISRFRRSSDADLAADAEALVDTDGNQKQCIIEVQVVKEIKGKCIRLRGGASACQSADYLDPFASSCSEES